MTLWAMAKSPLMFGGDVRKLDETTYYLITNPMVLEINTFSSNNKEACEHILIIVSEEYFPLASYLTFCCITVSLYYWNKGKY